MGEVGGPITRQGPFVDLKVMASHVRATKLRQAGLPAPAPVTIRALVDTGASLSAIDRNIVRRLGLVQTGSVPIHTPTTGSAFEERGQYDACFVLGEADPSPLVITVGVIEADLVGGGFFALIGWDVLSRCVLLCDGPAGTFSLRWEPILPTPP